MYKPIFLALKYLIDCFIEWNIVSDEPIIIRSEYLGQMADVLMHKIPFKYRFL